MNPLFYGLGRLIGAIVTCFAVAVIVILLIALIAAICQTIS